MPSEPLPPLFVWLCPCWPAGQLTQTASIAPSTSHSASALRCSVLCCCLLAFRPSNTTGSSAPSFRLGLQVATTHGQHAYTPASRPLPSYSRSAKSFLTIKQRRHSGPLLLPYLTADNHEDETSVPCPLFHLLGFIWNPSYLALHPGRGNTHARCLVRALDCGPLSAFALSCRLTESSHPVVSHLSSCIVAADCRLAAPTSRISYILGRPANTQPFPLFPFLQLPDLISLPTHRPS